jgi:serine/threonine protein phosphatase PrpC
MLQRSDVSVASESGYGKCNLKCRAYHKEYTEDSKIVFSKGVYVFMCVADGHGGSYLYSKEAIKLTYQIIMDTFTPALMVDNISEQEYIREFMNSLCDMIHFNTHKNRFVLGAGGTTYVLTCVNTSIGTSYTANLGDSRSIIFRDGKIHFCTRDQDASNKDEQRRIREINPHVRIVLNEDVYRLNGLLMPVGGFGDFIHDLPIGTIRRHPDFYVNNLQVGDIIVVSSDGLYEHYTKKGFCGGKHIDNIARDICELQNNGCEHLSKGLIEKHLDGLVNECKTLYSWRTFTEEYITQLRDDFSRAHDNMAIITYTWQPHVRICSMTRSAST